MSTEEHDLSLYDNLIVEHYFNGFARSMLFMDRIENQDWNCNIAESTITFQELGVVDVEVLGSIAADGVFLWSWANQHMANYEKAVDASLFLQQHAEQTQGLSVFTEGRVPPDWVDINELAAVCGELLENYPFWIAPHNDLHIVFIVKQQTSIERFSGIKMPQLILDGQAYCLGDRKAALFHFLMQQGFQITDQETKILAKSSDGRELILSWDNNNQLVTAVNGELWA